jgi:hypothetical protein
MDKIMSLTATRQYTLMLGRTLLRLLLGRPMQLGTRMHKRFSKYPPSLRATIEKSGKIPRGTLTLLLLRLSIL